MHADIMQDQGAALIRKDRSPGSAPLVVRRLARVGGQTIVVTLAALMLLWVAMLNGRPSVFPDTALYYSQAEYLADAVGLVSPQNDRVPAGDPTALPAHPGLPNVSVTIDGGRSPIYGLFMYGLQRLGGLWLVAAAQAAMVALALYILFRAATPTLTDPWYLLWMAAICAFTSAPSFSSFIMPDVFGGVAGVVGLTILVYWDRVRTPSRVALLALLVFSLSVHRANLLAIGGLTAAAMIGLAWMGVPRWRLAARALAIGAAAATAWTILALAFIPINQRAGVTVRDPPFLMARIIADGPGRRYLKYICGHGGHLALCRFANLPAEDSDTLLWSSLATKGMFGVADYNTRLKLEAEEHGFVLGALAFDPIKELAVSGLNTLRQLGMTHVQSPLADPARFVDDGYWRRTSLLQIIPKAATCRIWGRCGSKISPTVFSRLQDTAMALSLAGLAACLVVLSRRLKDRSWPARAARDQNRRLLGLITLAGAFVLANAVVCGALSAPVARYEARLIWMIPALAMLISGQVSAPWLERIVPSHDKLQFLQPFLRLSKPAT